MTTVAQVKQAVRPLLERNSDLALVGRLIVIKPVLHLLRGVYFAGSIDHNAFTPTWLVVPMFRHGAHVVFNWGARLYNRSHGPWDIRNPATPRVMCEEIERHALPFVRSVQTVDDFANFASRERFREQCLENHRIRKIVIDIARGDFDSALAICAQFPREHPAAPSPFYEDHDAILPVLRPMLEAGDRAGLARVLHQWEADSIRACKLEKLWEPTPFPFELQPNESALG
jgi:hypothetical protein